MHHSFYLNLITLALQLTLLILLFTSYTGCTRLKLGSLINFLYLQYKVIEQADTLINAAAKMIITIAITVD